MIKSIDILRLTRQLVSIPSMSASKNKKGEYNENILAEFIAGYFKSFHIPTEFVKTPDGRNTVVARKKGTSKDTIVLIGHHDTVGVEDFGDLNPFDSDALAKEFKDKKYLYGRGAGDMKSGLAIGMSVFAELYNKDLKTNLIFISAPDEENASVGIIAAGEYLKKLKEKETLNYIGCISLDSIFQDPHHPNNYAVLAGGAVGKLLPCFYVVGKAAHVSEPFAGISSGEIAAEIVREIDCNVAYSDKRVPPPTCLKSMDLKFDYNVQLPLKSFLYFNYLTLKQSPKDVLMKMKKAAEKSLKKSLKENTKKYKAYMRSIHSPVVQRMWDSKVNIYTYDEVEKLAEKKDEHFSKTRKKILEQHSTLDVRDANMKVVEYASMIAGLKEPYIVVFYSPPYYPSLLLFTHPFINTVRKTVAMFAKEGRKNITVTDFCDGVSDMNYMQMDKRVATDAKLYVRNNPISQQSMEFNADTIAAISMPVVDIGPLAYNAHEKEDKADIEFSFSVVPRLLESVIMTFQSE